MLGAENIAVENAVDFDSLHYILTSIISNTNVSPETTNSLHPTSGSRWEKNYEATSS